MKLISNRIYRNKGCVNFQRYFNIPWEVSGTSDEGINTIHIRTNPKTIIFSWKDYTKLQDKFQFGTEDYLIRELILGKLEKK
jgi:hypothetical protein